MGCRDDECSLFNPYIDFGIKIDRLLTANDIAKGHNPGLQVPPIVSLSVECIRHTRLLGITCDENYLDTELVCRDCVDGNLFVLRGKQRQIVGSATLGAKGAVACFEKSMARIEC